MKTLGQWNAYCGAGDTHEERKARLLSAPAELQPAILLHLKTVHSLKKHAQRQAQKKRKRA